MSPARSAPNQPPPSRMRPLRYVPLLLLLMGAGAVLRPFVAESYDMAPGIQEGDLVLGIPRPTWLFGPLRRGDLVLLPPGNARDRDLRRIIGLPGEVVEVAGGRFLLEGAPLQSERLTTMYYTVGHKRSRFHKRRETIYEGPDRTSYDVAEQDLSEYVDRPGVRLGTDEYYVLADRRTGVRDSRDTGPLKRDMLRRIYAPVLIPGYRFLFTGLGH